MAEIVYDSKMNNIELSGTLGITLSGTSSRIKHSGSSTLAISSTGPITLQSSDTTSGITIGSTAGVPLALGSGTGTTTLNDDLVISSNTATTPGTGFDAATVTTYVSKINGEIITSIFIDIGGGSIVSSSSAGDVIGEDGAANAYVTRITTAINGVIYKGEFACIEVPTTGDPDINLAANSSGTIAEDAAGEGQHVLANNGTLTVGSNTSLSIPSGGIQNDYLYLTHGGTTAGTYAAGKIFIKLYGTPDF